MNIWYCQICGMIIEKSEGSTCPNCGLHEEFLHSFTIDSNQIEDMQHIIIIGNGIAGFSAAKTLRSLHCKSRITIFTKGNHSPHTSIKMNKDYLLNMDTIDSSTWYEEHRIEYHPNTEVTRIDTNNQEVFVHKKAYAYDILILAMGIKHSLPNMLHNDFLHIYTIDAFYDQNIVRNIVKPDRHGVIIGSDLQSIELACALSDAHVQVDMIEALPHIVPKELNTLGAELLSTYLQTQKIHLHTGASIKQFHGVTQVESIELNTGICINADFVIVEGVLQSNLTLLKDSDIQYDKRIHVDENMRTNKHNVYACGGVTHCFQVHENNWLRARQQGVMSALSIMNVHLPFMHQTSPRYFKHDDYSVCIIGNIHHYDQHIELFDELRGTYEKYCYNENQNCGVLLLNSDAKIEAALKHYHEKGKFSVHK